jgi:transposase
VRTVRDLPCGEAIVYVRFQHWRVACAHCGGIRHEYLSFLAKNKFYTKRFAIFVGRQCEQQSVKAVAEELHLDWKTVKELDKEYMRENLKRAPEVHPEVIGIDEISIRKGHTYRIVVSDLKAGRPIWFGGDDRSEESTNMFYESLGADKCSKIQLIVMDMWRAFEKSAKTNAPQAAIMYDKFHVIRQLGDAMDDVRKSEYRRLGAERGDYIKGQKYALLSHEENLTLEGKAGLHELLKRNRRLHTAYLLKESFDRLWDYTYPASARKFFDNWKASLKWQRLKPFEEFAALVERHWDGVVAYCEHADDDIRLGFVEGLNNKIRVFQRRAYGLRDEAYLRLKVLTSMLPPIKDA